MPEALFGRDAPLAEVHALLHAAHRGHGRSMLLLGGSGLGLTALLETAAETAAAQGFEVVRLCGTRSAQPLAGVRDIAGQLRDAAEQLTSAQRAVLRAGDTQVTAGSLVLATAVLSLVHAAAQRNPVLITLDDADLFDRHSADALAFVARRLARTRSCLLAASHSGGGVFSSRTLDRLHQLTQLADGDANALLAQRFPLLPATHRQALAEQGCGNPAVLIETGFAAVAALTWLPGERVADASAAARLLVDASARARQRGDIRTAVNALTQVATITADDGVRARCLLRAACLAVDSLGDFRWAAELYRRARQADPGITGALDAATVACQLAVDADLPLGAAATRLGTALMESDTAVGADELGDALWTLLELCWVAAEPELWALFGRVVERHRARLPPWAFLGASQASGSALPDDAHREAADRLFEHIAELRDPSAVVRDAFLSRSRDQRSPWQAALERVWDRRPDHGAAACAVFAAMMLTIRGFETGDWPAAENLTRDALELAGRHGYRFVHTPWLWYIDALLAAARGAADTVESRTEQLLDWGITREATSYTWRARHARAVLQLGSADPAAAHRTLLTIGPPARYLAAVASDDRVALDFAEAAVGAGATEHVAELRALLSGFDTAGGRRHALLYRGALAILADDDFDVRFEAALTSPDADQWPFHLARIRLCYGERLRAADRADAARRELRIAAAAFRHLGAVPWATRAAQRLRALGAREPSVAAAEPLTAMERRIADLAASGLTNQVIGSRLHLSASTVSGHLSRAYGKLGLSSRAGLRDALSARAAEGPR